MKIKNVKLEWNVLVHDFNRNIIQPYNIFYSNFPEELAKEIKSRKIDNRDKLKEYLRSSFMHSYWCKAEYEILVSGLFIKDSNDQTKIDIWYQIEMNFDLIVNYIIDKMKLFNNKEEE